MRIMFLSIGCLLLLNLGCSHFKMETPRQSQATPTAPEVYHEDIEDMVKRDQKIK